jgi:hypothetical protein
MTKYTINESELRNMIHESIKKILSENNFKNGFDKRKAAIYINGKKQGKTPEEIRQDMLDDMAKSLAIRDINRDRSVRTMSRHEKRFNNAIENDTFTTDFTELDYYDPQYDDFSKNNKPIEGYEEPWYFGPTDYID